MTVHAAPNVFVIHLKRFSFGGSSGKINKKIDFDFLLEVNCTAGDREEKELFSLIGIVVHHGGSINSGHYVAFIKVCAVKITDHVCFTIIPRQCVHFDTGTS
jgi:ubiquitin carboxyl-terminal hydrolase 36/42